MSCDSGRKTMLACITAVCRAADAVVTQIAVVRQWIAALIASIGTAQSVVSCVLDGPVGGTCAQPGGGVLPTLAERLDSLNAASVAAIVPEAAVATAGQLVWTLSSVPDFVEIGIDGALLTPYEDYVVAGADVTFTHALAAGDELRAWKYML